MHSSIYVARDDIRSRFSEAMSAMYREEIPLYGELIDIVAAVNERTLAETPALASELRRSGEIGRLSLERHGAIRLGTPQELSLMRRAFAVMGMYPVGYYDLSVAGVPVHSTAFRPTHEKALARNPFRVFTSLLRLELIEDPALRKSAEAILAGRRIFTRAAIGLIERAETQGGLTPDDAEGFVDELLETFRWHSDAKVDGATYARLHDAHRLIADIVSFRGPHINHLTPRTLDIDAAQTEMKRRGIGAKAVIEGPPRRKVPILLRQTSFKAVEENVTFAGAGMDEAGVHSARFGEIEQRGVALTRRGKKLYDLLLAQARGVDGSQGEDYERRLSAAFKRFPDSFDELRRRRLAYFRYAVTDAGHQRVAAGFARGGDLEAWLSTGSVKAEPIVYEDFLPVSAAGIFQSNLGGGEQRSYSAATAKESFEQALGAPVLDEFELYEALATSSLIHVRRERSPAAANAAVT